MNISLSTNKLLFFLIIIALLPACDKMLPVTGNLDHPLHISQNTILGDFISGNIPDALYVLLTGKDGAAALIFRTGFPHVLLERKGNKWNSRTEHLPDLTNITDLKEISVFLRNSKFSLNILTSTEETDNISPFTARLQEYSFIGSSQKNKYLARKYKYNSPFRLEIESDSALAVFSNGSEKWLYPDSDHKINDLKLKDYYFTIGSDTLLVLWKDPPACNPVRIREKIMEDVAATPVMIIILDSLGWSFYQHLLAVAQVSFLTQFRIEPLKVPYPPCTKNTLASLIDNEPAGSGKQEISFFPDIPVTGKVLILEADQAFYSSEHEMILHIDGNANGSSDDEIFHTALERLDENHALIFVHFHSIDDIGHAFGTYSRERIAGFTVIEYFIQELWNKFPGKIYLLSDHGMHDKNGRGEHKTADHQDLLGIWSQIK